MGIEGSNPSVSAKISNKLLIILYKKIRIEIGPHTSPQKRSSFVANFSQKRLEIAFKGPTRPWERAIKLSPKYAQGLQQRPDAPESHKVRRRCVTPALLLKISASEIGSVVGAKAKEIDIWLQRPELIHRFKSTRHGARRSMSRENALQLAFLAAFVKAGIKVSQSIELSERFLKLEKSGRIKEWILFNPGEDLSVASQFDEFSSIENLKLRASTAAPALVVAFAARETVRRIDNLFSSREVRRELESDDSDT